MANSAPSVLKLKSYLVPRQRGELARLRVIRGPDRGAAYILVNTRASIGRGEENDIMIGDLKASRLHAEITASPRGWQVRDLGSANGVLHNGVQSRAVQVRTADIITIGETVMEFLGSEASPEMLLAGPRDEFQAERMLSEKLEGQGRPRTLSDPFGLKSAPAATTSAQPGRQKAIRLTAAALVAIAAVAAWDMLEQKPAGPKKSRKPAAVSSEAQDLASLMPKFEKAPTSRNAEMFFKQGFREYRERNYIRALNQFELVLQLIPDHEMARRYRDNARLAIEDEVRKHLEFGKKTFSSGKLREARGHYEAILRLLHSDQSNPAYSEAKIQLEQVKSEMEGG